MSPMTSTTLYNSMSLPLPLPGRLDRPPPTVPLAHRRPPSFVLPAHRPKYTRIRWKEALVLFSALSLGVLETLARNGRIARLGRSGCLGDVLFFLRFWTFWLLDRILDLYTVFWLCCAATRSLLVLLFAGICDTKSHDYRSPDLISCI